MKEEISLLSEIKLDKELSYANFKDVNNFANFKLIKCIHLLFNKKNVLKNTDYYLVLITFIVSIISILIFSLRDFFTTIKNINQICCSIKTAKGTAITLSNPNRKKKLIFNGKNKMNNIRKVNEFKNIMLNANRQK